MLILGRLMPAEDKARLAGFAQKQGWVNIHKKIIKLKKNASYS